MKLSKLLEKVEYSIIQGNPDVEITDLILDSRKASTGCAFICIKGAVSDGHKYAKQVLDNGSAALIIEHDLDFDLSEYQDVAIIKVNDARVAGAYMSAAWFEYPALKLKTIGITGTKGKTTTSYMVKSALEACGFKVGLIGTIEIIIGDKHIPAKNTTPEFYDIHKYFKEMVDNGIDVVVMEVSSQALMLNRTAGINFDIGVFTNLGKDHIGDHEHKDFDDYKYCKSLLFKQCKVGIGNIDDEYFEYMFENSTCDVKSFGLSDKADIQGKNVKLISGPGYLGIDFDVVCDDSFHVTVDVPGRFSVYNSLTAISICKELGASNDKITVALKDIKVKGRVEMVKISDKFTLMIDYAHNAMALESLLATLKEYTPRRLVTLFGCGGDRSKDRRYEMGEVSGHLSDFTIITSDNPRTEEPQAIIDDIKIGMAKTNGKFIEICDRKEAIEYAITHAQDGDVIILAGKGHEDYQEINGVKYDMDERVIIADIVKRHPEL